MKKLHKYIYVIDGMKATYEQNVADRAKKDGKNVLAVPVQYADVANLEYDENYKQIELSMYSYEDMVEFAQKYAAENAEKTFEDYLKCKIQECIDLKKKYNEMLKICFDNYEFDDDGGWY